MLTRTILTVTLFQIFLWARGQDVELVVCTGYEMAQCVAFSQDNRILAKLSSDKVSFWDIPTSRLIRMVDFTNNPSFGSDTIYFNASGLSVTVGSQTSNDTYVVDAVTGEAKLITGPPKDWTGFQYKNSNYVVAATFLSDKSKKSLSFKSPDGQTSLVLGRIKSPFQFEGIESFMFTYELVRKGAKPIGLDSSYTSYFGYSGDSKYLFLNGSIYDVATGGVISTTKYTPLTGGGLAFLPGTHIPITCRIGGFRFWDFPDVSDLPLDNMYNFQTSPDGKYAVAEQYDEKLKQRKFTVVDMLNRKALISFNLENFMTTLQDVDVGAARLSFYHVDVPSNSQNMAKSQVFILDGRTGEKKLTLENTMRGFFISGNRILVDSSFIGSFVQTLGQKEKTRFPIEGWTRSSMFWGISNSQQHMLSFEYEMRDTILTLVVSLHNTTTGKVALKTDIQGIQSVFGFEVSPDQSLFALGSVVDGDILVYDLNTGAQLHRLKGHNSVISRMAFSDDNKRLLSSSSDGTVRLWNLEKGEEMVSLISTGEKDYAIVTPQKYYFATKGAQKFIHFVRGQEIFPFEQFDLKFNRPDIIIETMEASNQELKEPFYHAYLKRLQRLGYSEEMLSGEFHLPKIIVANKESLPLITSNPTVALDVSAIDSKYIVDRIMVRINGVPVSGSRGLDVKSENLQHVKKQLDVQLSEGINHISVSALNEKGVESIPVNIDITHASGSGKLPVLHLVTLGVSEYKSPEFNLNYAAKDSRDLMTLYSGSTQLFSAVVQYHFENADVTTAKLTEIRQTLEKTNENDIVCVFFAGHGLLDENLDYYLAAHNVNFQNPSEGGIPYGMLEGLLDGIPARKKILMIDACHSGEIDKEEVAWAEDTSAMAVEDGSDLAFRAVTTSSLKQVGLQNSFELMKELFSDIRKSSGTVVISSAGGTEYAMEGGEWNNGVFTYSLLSGIGTGAADLNLDGKIMVNELSNYIHDKVIELTAGRQSPTNRAENHESDWRMW